VDDATRRRRHAHGRDVGAPATYEELRRKYGAVLATGCHWSKLRLRAGACIVIRNPRGWNVRDLTRSRFRCSAERPPYVSVNRRQHAGPNTLEMSMG